MPIYYCFQSMTMDDADNILSTVDPNSTDDYYYDYVAETHRILDLSYVFLGVFGVLDNGFVVLVILKYTHLTSRLSGLLILNQTLVDLAVCVTLILDYAVFYEYGINVPVISALAGDLYCRLFFTEWLQWGLMISSTHSLVLINLERYMSVVHPIRHNNLTRRCFAWPAIAAVWLVGPLFWFLWGIPSTHFDGTWCWSYDLPTADLNLANGLMYLLLNYFIPLIAMFYFYGAMLRIMLKRKPALKPAGQNDNNQQDKKAANKMSTAQKNLTKTLVIITLCFILCLSWDQLMWFFYVVGVTKDYYGDLFYYSFYLSCFSSCINPFIYIINYRDFKVGIKKMFGRGKINGIENSASVNKTTSLHM